MKAEWFWVLGGGGGGEQIGQALIESCENFDVTCVSGGRA